METISVKCPICEEKSEIRIVTMGQTVHRCKACSNLVKIVEDKEAKKSFKKKMKKKATKKKTSKKKSKKKKSDER